MRRLFLSAPGFAALVGCGVVVVFLVSLYARDQESYSARSRARDEQLREQLRRQGADLTERHEITFFTFFDGRNGASDAAASLGEIGFETAVVEAANEDEWVCEATTTAVPTLAELARLGELMESVAHQFAGEYDGWEADVTR